MITMINRTVQAQLQTRFGTRLGVIGAILFAVPALAFQYDMHQAFIRQELKEVPVRIQGSLRCEDTVRNTATNNDSKPRNSNTCSQIAFYDPKTGKTYRVNEGGEHNYARELLEKGRRDVTIEGVIANEKTLRIRLVEQL